jgi:competence protein ComGF
MSNKVTIVQHSTTVNLNDTKFFWYIHTSTNSNTFQEVTNLYLKTFEARYSYSHFFTDT